MFWPQAFVRFCAVYGAATVLRTPVQALVIQTEAEAGGRSSCGTDAGSSKGAADASGGSSNSSCVGLVTGTGQLVRCKTLVAGAGTLA